ncbi:DNA-directed RNA polymerase subunit alpha [Candidatus Tremblaya phenacola]|uniref:DNA-directed RNA polymerase subunit alpha n=2 Tax=Candidatus Tremblayella phenacoccinincola TaxID=1010676 RepID=A0A2G0V6V4_9PROT|nr:DNA-directed RNA polymerase subunit alpha [Candidatus Tremblaya phenacola]
MLIPQIVSITARGCNISQFSIEPLDRGYGDTLGCALRRTLLTSVCGTAVTEVEIVGSSNEFSSVAGIAEDSMQLALNIRSVVFKLDVHTESLVLTLRKTNPGVVYARDIQTDYRCQVVNPNHIICHLDSGRLSTHIKIQKGWGYVPKYNGLCWNNGKLILDAFYSPVKNVSYSVSLIKYSFERLVLNIETNGSVTPSESLRQSIHILKSQLSLLSV